MHVLLRIFQSSVADSDWYVFARTGSVSASQSPEVRIRIGIRLRILPPSSKNSKKTLDPYCMTFYPPKNDVNVPPKNNRQKNLEMAGSGYGSISQRQGSSDTDPYQNVTDLSDPWRVTSTFREKFLSQAILITICIKYVNPVCKTLKFLGDG